MSEADFLRSLSIYYKYWPLYSFCCSCQVWIFIKFVYVEGTCVGMYMVWLHYFIMSSFFVLIYYLLCRRWNLWKWYQSLLCIWWIKINLHGVFRSIWEYVDYSSCESWLELLINRDMVIRLSFLQQQHLFYWNSFWSL